MNMIMISGINGVVRDLQVSFYTLTITLLLLLACVDFPVTLAGENDNECIKSKISSPCNEDADCFLYEELHLFCNKTRGANVCAYQIETYAGEAEGDKDCPGEEFSATPWSNPISDELVDGSRGVDCMRWCYFTETCFAITVLNHQCYLKNDKCFTNLKIVQGALLGVMSVVREDYHCGCHYPFTRRRSNGEILSWTPDCPESQLDRNPYRCCSEKGLCTKCSPGQLSTNKTNHFSPIPSSFHGVAATATGSRLKRDRKKLHVNREFY